MYHLLDAAMEALHQAVGFGMIGCGALARCTEEGYELPPWVGLKLHALFGDDRNRCPEVRHPF